MPLVNMHDMLKKAEREKYGVGNFDVFNLEILKGVLDAGEQTRSPIILAYGEGFEDYVELQHFAPMLVRMAQKASVPVAVHLDHAVNLSCILQAVYNGFTSVMIDASDKPLRENIEVTKKAVEICRVC